MGGGIGDGPNPTDAPPASSSSSSSPSPSTSNGGDDDDDDDVDDEEEEDEDDDDASGQFAPPDGVHDPAASSYLVPSPHIVTLPIASPEFPPPFFVFNFGGSRIVFVLGTK